MGRAPCCDKANVKRGPWSPEEDATLKRYVETHGIGGNWIALPQKAGLKRCGKSCRLRWLNYLRPDIKHGGFTEEEDNIICSLYSQMGSRWSLIASQLPGRTDNDVKNYWNTKLKKKLFASKTTLPLQNTTPIAEPPLLCVPKPEPLNNFDYSSPQSHNIVNSATLPVLTDTGYGVLTNFNGPQSLLFSSPDVGHGSQFVPSSSSQDASETMAVTTSGNVEDGGMLPDFGFEFPYDLMNGLWTSTTQDHKPGGIFPC
ncbi:hypothetical protein SLA2020_302040 [Shorea laevis]